MLALNCCFYVCYTKKSVRISHRNHKVTRKFHIYSKPSSLSTPMRRWTREQDDRNNTTNDIARKKRNKRNKSKRKSQSALPFSSHEATVSHPPPPPSSSRRARRDRECVLLVIARQRVGLTAVIEHVHHLRVVVIADRGFTLLCLYKSTHWLHEINENIHNSDFGMLITVIYYNNCGSSLVFLPVPVFVKIHEDGK